MKKTKKITFETYDSRVNNTSCNCMINNPSWDVFINNCPLFKRQLRYGTCLEKSQNFADLRRVIIALDMDYIEYQDPAQILSDNISEIRRVSHTCPFNAAMSKMRPVIDTSCLDMKLNNQMVTEFIVRYAGRARCKCNLGVQAFSVFERNCPVCCNGVLVGNPQIDQLHAYGNQRSVSIDVDRTENEATFMELAARNLSEIQNIAKRCVFNRGQK